MAPVMDDQVVSDDSIAKSRSRRTKKDKTGRLAALERLKEAKSAGGKNKYELTEESNVYEEVDEEEYSKIVRERREDDWIVDDDGAGYAEDGREIFDEDLKDDNVEARKGSKKGKEKKKANPNIRATDSKPKSIRSMFAAAAVKSVKRKVEDVNLKDDDVLGDIMAELHQKPSSSIAPAPIKLKKKATKSSYNPFAAKPAPSKRPVPTMPCKAEPSRESEEAFQSPKVKKVPLPRRVMKTALDSFNDDSAEIDDFPSQATSRTTSQPTSRTNGRHEEERISQQIDESSLAEDTSMEMEISGIDFDDDFDQENEINGHNTKPNKNAKIQVRSVDELPEAGVKWETIKGGVNCDIPMDVKVDASQLPLTTSEDGQHQVLRMYWLDAYEDPYKQPGVVYLFGKVWIEEAKSCVSCCVTVRNIERKMFLLPRSSKMNLKTQVDTGEQVTFLDVYKEFNDVISEKYKIMVFKAKKCVREYAFEKPDIPVESEYLELRYSAEYPALPADLKGETFSHIFGTNTSSLENFLLEQKIKGPGWLDIKMPQIPNPGVSWCKVEAFVNKPEYVTTVQTPAPPPPLVVMTLNLRTVPDPKTHQIQIVGIACLVQHKFHIDKPPPKQQPFQQHFCAITTPTGSVFPFDFREQVQKRGNGMKVEVIGTERALLGFLLAKIHKADPDIIVGHDVLSFDLDVLLHRINLGRVPHWSRLGRLKRANMPKLSTGHTGKFSAGASATCGRLVCDVKVSSKELIRCRSYDLTELVSHILKEKRQDIDQDQLPTFYNQSSHLLQLTEWTLMDSSYILKIMYELNVMPLAAQITNICGNVMSRTLMGGRSERNEYLLLHAFTEKNFVVPDKASYKKQQALPADGEEDAENASSKKSGRRKPAYSGGLVLEPKKGFYDKFILLLDFNSLYPSIIQEYNICFTTISRTPSNNKEEDPDNDWARELPDSDLEPGVLPTEIRKLVQSRKQVKQLMKGQDVSPEQYQQYDIRQKALKLTANSMYGCLGFTFSRFYAKPLAALVTGKGREILLKTKDMVQNMNLDVIYGDTDSIMVNTNSTDIEQVFKLGTKIKNEVNKLYKLLEIDIDGVFKSMLLLKKKKYAALTIQKSGDSYVTAQELKGLDIVRRDWCELAKEAGNFVISQILSGESRESIVENIHSRLIEVGQKVKDGEIPVDLYLITKQLTKNPEDYPDKKNLAHVQVALRVNSKGGKTLRAGDTVRYLICEDGSTLTCSQRAYSPAELEKRDDLKIDIKYYLANQIHPVVSRLCDPIDGTDTAHIAECLGLDPSGYRHSMRQQEDDEDDAMLGGAQVSPEEKYRDCERLRFNCPACGKEIILDSPFTGAGSVLECTLEKCPNLECKTAPAQYTTFIQNKITLQIRARVKKYYEGWLKCEDSACGARTRKLPLEFYKSQPGCPTCHRGVLQVEYPDATLYNQLCFYHYLFDIDKAIGHMKDPIEKDAARYHSKPLTEQYRQLKSHVDDTIKHSAYSEVDLSRLFDGLFTFTGPR